MYELGLYDLDEEKKEKIDQYEDDDDEDEDYDEYDEYGEKKPRERPPYKGREVSNRVENLKFGQGG